jgi:hypothetical protein
MFYTFHSILCGSRICFAFHIILQNWRNDENRIDGITKKKLSSAFEKDDSQWKHIFWSWHSRTKTILKSAKNRIFKNEKVHEENLCSLRI